MFEKKKLEESVKNSHIVTSKACSVFVMPPSLYRTARLIAKSVFSTKHHLQSETNSAAQNKLAPSILLASDPCTVLSGGLGGFFTTFLSSTLITHIKIGGKFLTDVWFLLKWSHLFSKTLRTQYRTKSDLQPFTKHFHAIFYRTLITILEIQSANVL